MSWSPDDKAWAKTPEGLQLAIRLQPGAKTTAIGNIEFDAQNRARLKCWVCAPPEDGKANTALIKLLAKAFKRPKSALSILSGQTSREKLIGVEGIPEDLEKTLLDHLA